MQENIRAYVDELFQSAPKTQKAYEMKLEMTQSLIDHYRSLLSEGKSESDAYSLTIMSIGDVSELFYSLDDFSGIMYQPQNQKRKSAAITAIAVMMYILCVVPLILFSIFNLPVIGLMMMFVMVAAATGILVYNSMTKPKAGYLNRDDVVSEFRDWKVRKNHHKQIMSLINGIYWPCVLTFYFVISFATQAWWITWLIFVIAPALFAIIRAILTFNDDSGNQ